MNNEKWTPGLGLNLILAAGVCVLSLTAGKATGAVYVDACATPPGNGSPSNPYATLTLGVSGASAGDSIVIQNGAYAEHLVIAKALTLTASGGSVLVGQYYVGTREVCVPLIVDPYVEPDGTCSPDVNAKIYYPSRGSGSSEVACGGPFPTVVYAHGNRFSRWELCPWSEALVAEPNEDYRQADGILRDLAATGLIVISVDNSPGSGDWTKRGGIVINTLAYLRDQNAPGGLFDGAVDLGRVGLSGHSLGGAAAMYAAVGFRDWPYDELDLNAVQIQAVGLIAPGYCPFPPWSDLLPAADVAMLVIHGTNDHDEQVWDIPVELYGKAQSRPKHLVVVSGANHFGYTDAICLDPTDGFDNSSEVGGVTGQEAQARQQLTARNYLRSFFRHELQGDSSEGCYLRQNTGNQCTDPGDPAQDCSRSGWSDYPIACGAPQCYFGDLQALNVEVTVCSCME